MGSWAPFSSRTTLHHAATLNERMHLKRNAISLSLYDILITGEMTILIAVEVIRKVICSPSVMTNFFMPI